MDSVKTVNSTIVAPIKGGLKFVLSVARVDGGLDNPMMDIFSKRWSGFRKDLASIYATRTGSYKLGFVAQPYCVQSDVWVMHCVCINEKGKLDLNAFRACLSSLRKSAKDEKATLHVSNILLAKFPKMSKLIEEEISANGIMVYIYEEPN